MKNLLFIILLFCTPIGLAQTVDELVEKGESEYINKAYKSALKNAELALAKEPTHIDALLLKAEALIGLENYQGAYDAFSQGIKLHPESSFFYTGRSMLLTSLSEFEYALDDINMAIELAETDTIKYYGITNRAMIKAQYRDFEGAYVDLKAAYDFDPYDLAVLTNLGAICDEIGKGEETLTYLLEAVAVDPEFLPAYGNIGFKYQEMGKYEKAIEYFDKVIEMDPNEPLGYSNRAFNYMKVGELKKAMSDINKSISMYPENSYAYKVRAMIHIENDKFDKACEDIQTALNKDYTLRYGNDVLELQDKHCRKKELTTKFLILK